MLILLYAEVIMRRQAAAQLGGKSATNREGMGKAGTARESLAAIPRILADSLTQHNKTGAAKDFGSSSANRKNHNSIAGS